MIIGIRDIDVSIIKLLRCCVVNMSSIERVCRW